LLGMQIELGPSGPRQRPFLLIPLHEFLARMANLKLHSRLFLPSGSLALEKMAEEAFLQRNPAVDIEGRKMGVAVDLEPFFFRCRAREPFEISARMQPLATPVCRRKHRYLDLGKVPRARAVVIVAERARENVRGGVGAIARELLVGQVLGACDELIGEATASAALTDAVLHAGALAGKPALEKLAEDPTVARQIPVIIGGAFPHANRGKVRRREGGNPPLIHRVIGNAVQPDLAIAPRLHARPFDAVVEIPRLARGPHVQMAG